MEVNEVEVKITVSIPPEVLRRVADVLEEQWEGGKAETYAPGFVFARGGHQIKFTCEKSDLEIEAIDDPKEIAELLAKRGREKTDGQEDEG